MNIVKLQFSKPARFDLGSFDIEWFGAGAGPTDVTHLDIVMPDGRLLGARSDRGGAPRAGVQIRAPDYINFARRVIVEIPLRDATNGQPRAVDYTWLLRQVGKPYDWLAIVAFAVKRDWRKDGAWFCSELGIRFLEIIEAFVPQHPVFPANKVTPPEALAICSVLPGASWTEIAG